MKCESCSETISTALLALQGVDKATVSLTSGHASVTFDPTQVNREMLKAAVRGIGYEVLPAHGEEGRCCGSCGG